MTRKTTFKRKQIFDRKHYTIIAGWLNEYWKSTWDKVIRATLESEVNRLVNDWVVIFKRDNPDFNEDEWRKEVYE
jgi:hypothetical protein